MYLNVIKKIRTQIHYFNDSTFGTHCYMTAFSHFIFIKSSYRRMISTQYE